MCEALAAEKTKNSVGLVLPLAEMLDQHALYQNRPREEVHLSEPGREI